MPTCSIRASTGPKVRETACWGVDLHSAILDAPERLTFRQIWNHPLPLSEGGKLERFLCRTMTTMARRYVVDVLGEFSLLAPERGPQLIVLNHSQRLEAVLIPSLMFFYRHGKPVHFLADWPFLLVPGVATLYRHGHTIITTQKSARPKFLNVFKPLFKQKGSAFDRALAKLQSGSSVGLFPEGTINRHPKQLMRGLPGAARLALQSGVTVLPVGLRFPKHPDDKLIPDGAAMTMVIGEPLTPPPPCDRGRLSREEVWTFHEQIMNSLAEVSGKSWTPRAKKRRKYVSATTSRL